MDKQSLLVGIMNVDRLKILGCLAIQRYNMEEIASKLKIKSNKLYHHITILKDLGLLKEHAAEISKCFELDVQALNKMRALLKNVSDISHVSGDYSWEKKVLTRFIEDDQVMSIPASRKKRQVILDWLIEKFECGRKYTEKEINDIISRYHTDQATLRREFIINKMMKREDKGSYYWRV